MLYTSLCIVRFNPLVDISDVVSCLTLITVAISGIFAMYKWNKNLKLKRAEYIKTLVDEVRSNDRMAFDLFDYNVEWYGSDFHQSVIEKQIDYTLSFFSYICYLYKQKIILQKEFNYFKYELERILNNSHFQNYIYNLYHFSQRINQPISFVHLFEYAKKHKYFDNDFWDKNSKKYPHILNF